MSTAVVPEPTLYDSPEILSLVQQVRGGSEPAFTTLYKIYYPRVLSVCRRMVADEFADHIANWALTRAWLKIKGFKGDSSFSTWVIRIATTTSLMHLRDQQLERHAVAYSLDEPPTKRHPSHRTVPHAERAELAVRDLNLEGVVDKSALIHEIAAIPNILRTVLILRLVQGLSAEETSICLNLDLLTVRSRLWRARRMLRERLARKYWKN